MLTVTEEKIIQLAKAPSEGPHIVVLGGGTGLSTLLHGLKLFSTNLTAVVTVADNGGSSGMLRQDLGMLPPGDIRNCILALADAEPLMNDLLNYRFQDGRLQGQNFGNLLIAAMNSISDNFADAVRNVSRVLAVKGRVLPVSLQDIQIGVSLSDQSTIVGESEIGLRENFVGNPIEKAFMLPESAAALPEAVSEIIAADAIVIGPGSLYTSLVPHMLFPEIRQAIRQSGAVKIFVCNLMTQPSETLDYTASDHLRALIQHAGQATAHQLADYIIVSDAWIKREQVERYQLQSASPVTVDAANLEALGVKIVQAPLVQVTSGLIRHDHNRLARIILDLTLNREKIRHGD